jgi:hypothetical protein
MEMKYSSSAGCFYPGEIDYTSIPDDAITVTLSDFNAAMSRPAGSTFSFVDGVLVIVEAPTAAPYVPASVSPAQARLALHGAGLLAQVEAIVAGADVVTQIAWNSASTIERASPTVAALSAALGLTDAQLDDLFTAAAAIRV